jgi:hypothetical protein
VTFAELLVYVRALLQDEVEPYRHSDAKLLALASSALQTIHRRRPDLVLGWLYEPVGLYTPSNLADQVPIHPNSTLLVGDMIVYYVELSEDESTRLDRVVVFDNIINKVLAK